MTMLINRIYDILEKYGADAILIENKYNAQYITGYTGDTGCVFISRREKNLYTDFRYIFQASNEATGYKVIDVQNEKYTKLIAEAIIGGGYQSVAFVGSELTYKDYMAYTAAAPGVRFVSIEDEVDRLRMVKNAYEIEQIKMAEHVGDETFTKILGDIRPGMTELLVAAKLEYYMKEFGAEDVSFPSIVASGINSSMPHATPTRKALEAGDFVTLDFGCKYNGYCSDMTRTIVLGKATDKQKDIYKVVRDAQMNVLGNVKAGMTGIEVDKLARDVIDDAGYGGCFGHGTGHGVGLAIHELPRASTRYDKAIEEDMTLTVEPGIYVEGYGGVRIEDLVVVKRDGHVNLTGSDKDLIEL